MGGFGDASKLPNPQPPQFGENDSFLTSDTPTCTSQVTNSAKACVQRMAPVLCNANSQDQINMVYSMENYNGTDRCGEPELIKTSGVQNFKSINSAQAKIAEKFSVAIRNSLSCLPPVMRDLTTDAQNSLTSSIKNILDSQGTLNMNLAKFQIGINTLLLKRRRLFNATVTNISNLCVINNAGNCAAWKWTEDEVLNATDFYISFATSWSSFVSVVSTEYNTIENALNSTSSCNDLTATQSNSTTNNPQLPVNTNSSSSFTPANNVNNLPKNNSRMLISSDDMLNFKRLRFIQGTLPPQQPIPVNNSLPPNPAGLPPQFPQVNNTQQPHVPSVAPQGNSTLPLNNSIPQPQIPVNNSKPLNNTLITGQMPVNNSFPPGQMPVNNSIPPGQMPVNGNNNPQPPLPQCPPGQICMSAAIQQPNRPPLGSVQLPIEVQALLLTFSKGVSKMNVQISEKIITFLNNLSSMQAEMNQAARNILIGGLININDLNNLFSSLLTEKGSDSIIYCDLSSCTLSTTTSTKSVNLQWKTKPNAAYAVMGNVNSTQVQVFFVNDTISPKIYIESSGNNIPAVKIGGNALDNSRNCMAKLAVPGA